MDKTVFIAIAVLAVLGVGTFFFLGSGASDSAVAAFRERLTAAREGRSSERLVEGTVQTSDATISAPLAGSDAVAFASWTQVRISGGSRLFRSEDLRFEAVPFDVQTPEGPLRVDGDIVGLSDLVPRVRGPAGEVETFVGPGDHVCVLGEVTEREGRPGFYGDVIVVEGTFDQWHAAVPRSSIASIPAQP